MSKMSILDRLGVLFEVSKSSKLYIIVILILIALGLGLSATNPKNQNRQKISYIMLTIFITVFAIVSFHQSIGNMISYMMDNLFIVIFFPNIAVYAAAMIITNVILWISIFSFKSAKPIRNLNIIVYSILTYVMLLLLNVISNEKLDVFSEQSIYGNASAKALIDISSFVFVTWIIFLVIYKLVLIYIKKDYAPRVKKVVIKKKVKLLPENYCPVDIPEYAYGKLPVRNNKLNLNQLESRFTLDEYKLFSKILKEQKEIDENIETFEVEDVPVKIIENSVEDSIREIINNDDLEKNSNDYVEESSNLDYMEELNKNIEIDEKENIIENKQKEESENLYDYDDENYIPLEVPIEEIFEKENEQIKLDSNEYKKDDEEERESNKYTELEMLYRGIY